MRSGEGHTFSEGTEQAMPCGCYEYHTADCPLITDRFGCDEPEPDDGPWDSDYGREYEPGEAPWERGVQHDGPETAEGGLIGQQPY